MKNHPEEYANFKKGSDDLILPTLVSSLLKKEKERLAIADQKAGLSFNRKPAKIPPDALNGSITLMIAAIQTLSFLATSDISYFEF